MLRLHDRVVGSDHRRPVRRGRDGRPAGRGAARVARLRQPDGAGRAPRGRDGARPRIRRRHRRAALGEARRADRQGVRARHDRRDARARAREQGESRRHERRVPQGPHRSDPAAVEHGGRDHLELRDQPLGRQATRARGGVPRAEAGRPFRGERRDRARGAARAPCKASMALWTGCVAGALEERSSSPCSPTSASRTRASSRRASTRATTRPRCSTGTGLDASARRRDGGKDHERLRARDQAGCPSHAEAHTPTLDTLGTTATAPRACGCDDDCCT